MPHRLGQGFGCLAQTDSLQTAMELLAAPEVLAKGPLEHIPETVAEAQLAVDDKFLYSLFQSNLCLKMHGKGA